ncbi:MULTISPECIES: anchored repeat ABC transporter, substrate-binding protein [unclassified Actinomyces]|uniref:anchored repeat ABC transporter, substrate-binding protein n=1 Tax=unclassified Actinomyces TaxID=2609248 RepID=UPI0020172995|nr:MULTISPECIES: anchored repeat ABC transporter, substrate-binding protein [unclassified Actinomyces]MCL3777470.1 anchored repeat ABC transporter, substrate-binding protein [Actinomyces sp. AC-20-1]MCL3790716.1 anchored repeat ABC transporter, substrate-binding protein [Actinomyces sp. 187325]MCL3793012.1 anchored repeat ABC transporter, substrate-binding protein [Actinomyces sp. 186855]MCL3795449.1 anchored repeat ABC transporter, substrate-binding protein [Actinomyces sp. 217892]
MTTGLLASTLVTALAGGCALPASSLGRTDPARDGVLNVVATTGILADLARNVAGDRAHVTQMVPDGADPHSWEPSLRSVRDVAYADLALSNYLLLEEHALIRTLDSNLPATAMSVSVAEEAAKNGATILPLVEDRSLDTVWLGMRVLGDGASHGANRSSTVDLILTAAEGPGQASAYLVTSFGAPEVGFTTSDGVSADSDTSVLPADAHQHMSWAFTKPGIYRLTFRAVLHPDGARSTDGTDGTAPVELGSATAVFAVGVSGAEVAAAEGRSLLGAGHADLTANLSAQPAGGGAGGVALAVDTASLPEDLAPRAQDAGGLAAAMSVVSLDDVVLEVPPRTLTQVPGSSGYRFVGEPGSDAYVLPQAVLGKHVHGDIDPHLWHDVHNAAAYVRVIEDSLIAVDPDGAGTYRANASAYLARLEELDEQVSATLGTIPEDRRHLVTTHDAYGYLANAYGLSVSGFIAPNPGVEPSVADRVRLAATLRDLGIPAVFLEPNLARTRSVLRTVAQEAGVAVCPLYGDTLDEAAPTYIDMMRFNADSLAQCLGGTPSKERP